MKKPAILLSTGVAALALAGAVGVGVATADPSPSPSATPSASATAAPTAGATPSRGTHAGRKHRGLLARALHGEVTLAGKEHRVVDLQRGDVTAVSGTTLSVRSADGFVGTYVVDATTKVRVSKRPAAIGDVRTGDRVRVLAREDGQTLTATRVVDRRP